MIDYKVEISLLAKEEIKGIALYIRNVLKDGFAANNFLDEIYNRIQDLCFMPGRYPVLNGLFNSKKNIRKISYSNFVILFEIKESDVIVLRVFHSSTNYQMN